MRQKGVSGEAPLSEVSAAADSLMVSVRIAIRRTSLCTPAECCFDPTGACSAVGRFALHLCKVVIAAAFSPCNYANSAGIFCAVFSAERCPTIPFYIVFCTEKI